MTFCQFFVTGAIGRPVAEICRAAHPHDHASTYFGRSQ